MVARVYHGSQSTTQLTGTSWTFWLMPILSLLPVLRRKSLSTQQRGLAGPCSRRAEQQAREAGR